MVNFATARVLLKLHTVLDLLIDFAMVEDVVQIIHATFLRGQIPIFLKLSRFDVDAAEDAFDHILHVVFHIFDCFAFTVELVYYGVLVHLADHHDR